MRSLLEKAIAAQFGSGVDVVVRSVRAWEDYIAATPFAGQADVSAKIVHLYLSRDQLNSDAAAVLEQRAQTMERIRLASGALWIDYGANGVGGSKLTPLLIDKARGSPMTGRNWNSVLNIREMIQARSSLQSLREK